MIKKNWKNLIPTVYTLVLIPLFISCDTNNCKESPDISAIKVSIEYEGLEDVLRNFNNSEEATALLARNRALADGFLHAQEYPDDSVLGRKLYRLMNAPSIDSLFMATKSTFGDFTEVMGDFRSAFRSIRYHYPHAPIPKFQSVVTGFYNDLYITDTLVIIGTDYFLGSQSKYRPQDIPQYLLKRYEKESVVPIVMSFISNTYNNTDNRHGDLLADMINLGKSYYFVSQVLPCTPDSLIIGYTSEEMNIAKENEEIIWANLIQNEMLYEKSHFLKNKFVGERPNVFEISEKCPGRIGAWVGWEIVKSYAEHNQVSLTELMGENDAHKIFQRSQYKPRTR